MRYYKLTKNNFEDALKAGKIYPENFREWGSKHCDIGYFVNHGCAHFFEEVSAGEYFVQEGKMPEYFAIKKVEDNPLWEKYIDWLIQTYKIIGRFDGSAKFYGYTGSANPNTIFENSIECIINNPIELTLEQWDQIINKTMEEFKLPAKWCTKIDNQEVVDYCNIHGLFPPYKIIKDENTYAHFPSWNGCTTCDGIKPGYTKITYEQFVKHVLNREAMEENKEIIGWKLKEDCEQYEQAALKLVNSSRFYSFAEGYNFAINSENESSLKKAGVLELWFEPVYKEKIIKFGGYNVTFEKVTSGVRITCNNETGTFSQISSIYNFYKGNSAPCKFGSQVVKEVNYPSASWELDFESEEPTSIKIGCTTGTWKEFMAIYEKAKSML